jgi:hypothetical protein
MTKPASERDKRLDQLKREVTRPGFNRHASILEKMGDLAPSLQSPAVTALTTSQTVQTIIEFPPQIHSGWQYVPRQALLFTPSGVIHLLASIWPDQPPQITQVDGCGIMYVKVKLLLLYGYLEIVAQGQTSPTRLGVEFNTVAWPYLSLPLMRFLQAAAPTPDSLTAKISLSPSVNQAFERLPLKFSNGLKIFGLLPGEQLENLVFQPGTWQRWLLFFRRPITADTLLLLTSNYMVVIQEELGIPQGWVLSYIPRECITEMQNRPLELCSELIVPLQRENQAAEYRLSLTSDAIEAWRMPWMQN